MANTPRSGSEGTLVMMARKKDYDTRVTTASEYIPFSFNPTLLRVNPVGEQTRSATIRSGRSDSLNTPGILSAGARWEGEMILRYIPHMLRGVFNQEPTSKPVADTVILAAASYTSGTSVTTFTASSPAAEGTDPVFPGKVEFTLSSAVEFASGKTSGALEITGEIKTSTSDAFNDVITETIPITALTNRTLKSRHSWAKINSYTPRDLANGTIALKFTPERYKIVNTLNLLGRQFDGWDWQYFIGGVPGAAFGVIPNTAEFAFQPEMRFNMDANVGITRHNRLVSNINEEAYSFEEDAAGTVTFNLTDFPEYDDPFVPGWGRALSYGSDTTPVTIEGLTLGVNNNYGPPTGTRGDRYAGRPIVTGDGFRQVTAEFETPYESGTEQSDTFQRWQDLYLRNRTERLRMRSYNVDDTGAQYLIQIDLPRFQLTSVPDLEAGGPAAINRTLTGKCVRSAGSSMPDEIVVTIWDANEYSETRG